MRGIITLVLVSFLCSISNLKAQADCDPTSAPDTPAAGCACAYPDCDFGLNGFSATLGTLNTNQTFPGCGNNILNNDDWISFIAGSTSIDITINVSNCQGAGQNNAAGVQAGFYSSCSEPAFPGDEGVASGVIDTQCGCITGNINLSNNNFVVGQSYYIVIDGCGGDICDYTIVVNSGSTTVQDPGELTAINGPINVCPGATATYTTDQLIGISDYEWNVVGGTIVSESGTSATVQWNTNGSITVSGSNACFTADPISLDVIVTPLTPLTADGEYCDNEAGYIYPANGQMYTAGFWPIDEVITSGPNQGCTQTTNLTVTTNPTYFIDVSRTICEGESVVIGGVPYTTQGTYNINLITQNTGCDSTIFLDLTVLNPLSIILDPSDLSCTVDQVIINGALSNADQYSWTTNNGFICAGQGTPVITACSIGEYCLEVTSFGFDAETGESVECTDQSCVTIGQDDNTPVLSPNSTSLTCGGQDDGTVTVEVTSGGVAPFIYVWNSSPMQFTQTATDLPAGNYTVTVTGDNGCTETASISVIEPAPLVLDMTSQDAGCAGASTGSATVNPTGGASGYQYAWNTNPIQNNQTASNIPAGTYTVTVTDANNCTSENSIAVGEATSVSVTIDPVNILCNGDDTGTATANGLGGTGTFTYEWNTTPIQTTQTAINLISGDYIVVVSDGNNCTSSASVTIGQPTALELTPSELNPECSTSADGEASVVAIGGVGSYEYEWDTDPVQTDATAVGLGAGTFTVIVTDGNGCTVTETVDLTAPNALSLSTDQVDVLCNGESTGEATVIATGGTAPLSYSWNDGATQNTPTAVNLEAGTYEVVVTDDNDCSEIITVTLLEPTEALSATGTSTNALCGASNGTIDLTVMGGTSPYTYDWGAAGTDEDPEDLGPGSYTVEVTDDNGCTTTATVTVNSPDSPSATVSITDVTCNGETNGLMDITVSGGIAPYEFAWDPASNDMNEDLENTGAGSYSVTVTDDAGCTVIATGIIAQPDELEATATPSPADCGIDNGSISVVVSGGTEPYTFDWPGTDNDGEQSPTDLAAGPYEVTITDDNGCVILASTDVIIPDGPTTSLVGTNVDCNGESTGTIELTIEGGAEPYTIDWSDPVLDGNVSLTDLPAGDYEVVVTDLNNCSSVAVIEIEETAILEAVTNSTDVLCFGSTDGTAEVIVTGGTGPYTYLWCDNQTSPQVNDCVPGICTVVVTDFNGCTITASVEIGEPTEMEISALPSDAECNGDSSGSIDVTVSGGTGSYTYDWTGGIPANTEDPVSLQSGSYDLVVSDENGCTMVVSDILIGEPEAMAVSFTTTEATCNETNGTIDLTVTGGTIPYTYDWTGGLIGEDPMAVGTGSYDVIITDDNGCTITQTVEVSTPSALGISSTSIDVDCNGFSSGSIDVTVSGGTMPFTYQWDDAELQETEDISDLPIGTYNVVVTDGTGCTITTSVTLTEPTAIELSATSTDATCNQSNGTIDLTVSGGVSPYTFDWSGADTDDIEDPQNLVSGNYNVTVTDDNGCTGVLNQSVETPSGLGGSTETFAVNCFGESNGSIDLTVVGGTGAGTYLYEWNDALNQVIEDPVNLPAGDYEVVVTDGDGCTIVASATVLQPALLEASGSSLDASCNEANGSILLDVTGGVEPYSYEWDGADNVEDPTDLFSGSYDVIVTDGNGCTVSTSVTVTEPDALALDPVGSDALCNGESSGSIDLSVIGGTGAGTYSYQWDDALMQTVEDPIDLAAGTYNVLVTDGNDCTITTSVVIGEPMALSSSSTTTEEICGESNGTIDLTVMGGTLPYSYEWSSPGIPTDTEDPTGLQAGNYNVTVTDGNDCTYTTTITVNTPNQLLATSTGVAANCNGESSGSIALEITGGTAPYMVDWGPLGMDEDPINVPAGNYNGVVTDSDGCEIVVSVSIGEPTAITSFFTSIDATCNESNGSIDLTVMGGTGPYTYEWDGGADPVEDPQGITAGNYNVTVTDDNGCTHVSSADVSTPSALALSTTSIDASCNEDTDGSIDLTVSGGNAPFSFEWSNSPTTEDISDLGAGTYTVTVTDGDDCTITTTVTIIEPDVLLAQDESPTSTVSCNGGNDGSANIVTTGGTMPYSYTWSDNSLSGEAPNNMGPGDYTVTVTDGNGCTTTAMVTIDEPAAIALNATSVSSLCFGSSDGSIDLTVTGGNSPYVFNWNSGTYVIEDPTDVNAGTYTVIVTDANGCSETTSIQVNQPNALLVNIDNVSNYGGTNVSCSDATDGSAEAFGVGGTAPYSFTWSTGEIGTSANNLGAGMYQVIITDANGCSSTNDVVLSAPAAINLTTNVINPLCFGENDGVISVEGSGGTAPYMYSLDGETFSTINQFAGLVSGVYSIEIQDANGCAQEAEAVVLDPVELEVDLGEDLVIQLGDSLELEPILNLPVVALDTFFWRNSELINFEPVVKPIETTTYLLTVINEFGCVDVDEIQVRVNKDRLVYIPNVFTPNGDGFNDVFTINGGTGVKEITTFRIFNRWGEIMYEDFNFLPNDPGRSWDGMFRGEMMNPGVFVYFTEIEFVDGRVEIYKGDVTLMR